MSLRAAASAAACLALVACAARGPLITPQLATGAPSAAELTDTPFFPQLELQCGPAALATVLAASGVPTTPDEISPLVFIPKRRGSLQLELLAAPRRFGRIAWRIGSELEDVVREISEGRPVVVLHNYGVPFLPRWHYAVVVGYDGSRDEVILRSGTVKRQVLSARNFMRAWDNGGRWAFVVLRPGELPTHATAKEFLEAAAAFQRVATPSDAMKTFDAAAKRWPEEPVAWIGRGTAHYRNGQIEAAARDYTTALRLDPSNVGARNNLAMALLELGCPQTAREHIDRIRSPDPESAIGKAVLDTRERITAALREGKTDDRARCASFGS